MFSPSTLINIIFDENATAYDLLHLVCALAIFWGVTFHLAAAAIHPLVFGKPWLKAAAERDYDHSGKEMYKKFGTPITREKFIIHFMNLWPWNVSVALQHLVGGALCIPAVFKIGDPAVASSLACLGILSEMGWEIEDTIVWLYKRFVSKKDAMPDAMLITLIVHHTMTTVLGIPIVLYYRNLDILHILTFELQAVAALSLGVVEYTKLLDVTKKDELMQFRILTFIVCAALIFTRGFHWSYLCAKLILVWYNDKAWSFLIIGSVVMLLFTMFNYFFCIQLFCKRFIKFMKMSARHNALPANACKNVRLQSESNLKASATNVMSSSRMFEENLSSLFVEKKTARRSTLPPSLDRNVPAIKRASLIMSRSLRVGDAAKLYNN